MPDRLFRRLPENRRKAGRRLGGKMDYDSCRSLPSMFFEQADRLGDKPFLWAKHEGHYQAISWAAAARDVRRLALGLRSLGIGRGERIGLVSENRPEWVIADLAIMSAGAITVPAYVTHTIDDHRHVLSNSGARAVIVSKPPQSARVLAAANQVSTIHTVIVIEAAAGQASEVDIRSWAEMLARGGEMADDTEELVATLEPDDIACLMHTSGTGGIPKGVMTSHRNILANCRGAYRLLRMVRLTVERRGRVSTRLFDKAVEIGRKRSLSQPLSFEERLIDPMLDRLVRAKLRRRFGGRLKAMVSGGAPLNPEIGSFFVALGIRLLQGYGQTEAAPVIACNSPARIKIDTVGPPLDGVRVKIADDGEILVAGDNIMKGYWNDPEATALVLEDGWLKTGDVGLIDEDGYIRITDRKRDFIKNSGGETISPARIEGYLTLEPEVAQAMVFGDRRPYLVALLVPDAEFAAGYVADGPAGDFRRLAGDPGFTRAIGAVVARVNQRLSPIERVRRFTIAAEPFTIANGQMTPTLKIKRHVIRDIYVPALDALYDSKDIAA